MSLAIEIGRIFWAFPPGDSRRTDVRVLASKVRDLENEHAAILGLLRRVRADANVRDLRRPLVVAIDALLARTATPPEPPRPVEVAKPCSSFEDIDGVDYCETCGYARGVRPLCGIYPPARPEGDKS